MHAATVSAVEIYEDGNAAGTDLADKARGTNRAKDKIEPYQAAIRRARGTRAPTARAIWRIKDRSSCQDFVRTIISFCVAARPEVALYHCAEWA